MFMGVPYLPFFIGAGGCLLLAMYISLVFLLFIPVVIFIMRQMARRDEMIFRLLGLNWRFALKARNRQKHGGMLVFSPNLYRKRPGGSKRDLKGPFVITGRMSGPVTRKT
jgi:type IV secretion system protein VirB3